MNKIVLTQTARWNNKLTNSYRTRYTEHASHYYQIDAEGLYTPWTVNEITPDGEFINCIGVAFNLTEARTIVSGAS